MNKYLLFSFSNYYPSGGMDDCNLKFNEMTDKLFKDHFINEDNFELIDEFQVYDTVNDKVNNFVVYGICQENKIDQYEDTEKLLDIFKKWIMQFK